MRTCEGSQGDLTALAQPWMFQTVQKVGARTLDELPGIGSGRTVAARHGKQTGSRYRINRERCTR